MTATKRRPIVRAQPAAPPLNRADFLRPIAHRGLHDLGKGRVENTAPAFRAAIERGYGIECDLQAASDDVPMVFHDAKLERLMDAAGPIRTYSARQLSTFRYARSDERLLRFAELLELIDGRVPLLVEVKGDGRKLRTAFLANIAMLARRYKGPIALMSFDRSIVSALGERAARVPRGAVIGSKQFLSSLWRRNATGEARATARIFGTPANDISFLAVDVKLVATARRSLTRHACDLPLFSWTIRTARQRATAARWADAPIFEGYEP